MTKREYVVMLVGRLVRICAKHGWGSEKAEQIVEKGWTKIESKHGILIYISEHEPRGYVETRE